MKLGLFGLVALGLMLAGCASSGPTRPEDIKGVYQIRNAPIPVPYPAFKPSRSKTNQGRTVVASRTHTSSSSLGLITVKRGNTLYSLAQQSGVSVQALVQANQLKPPYTLAVGQKLKVPQHTMIHTVKRGDTGYSISRRYGVTVSKLMRLNGVRKPYRLAVGQSLKIPSAKAAIRPTQTATASSPRVISRTPRSTRRSTPMPVPPPRTGGQFAWPVDGTLASRFGPKEGGLHNDGINILAKGGAAVRAAESGVVVYASNALEGYGNLLLLKHAGGWITAYAHNDRLLVRAGQKVTKRDVIARVGDTGGVQRPQLHFEIRKGRRALDPLQYLERQNAALFVTVRAMGR